jgi:hypothetical protein
MESSQIVFLNNSSHLKNTPYSRTLEIGPLILFRGGIACHSFSPWSKGANNPKCKL